MQQDEKYLQNKKSDQPPESLCLRFGGRFEFKLFYSSVFLGSKIVEILKGRLMGQLELFLQLFYYMLLGEFLRAIVFA